MTIEFRKKLAGCRIAASALALAILLGTPARAQIEGAQPTPGDPKKSIPEKIAPPEKGIPAPPSNSGNRAPELPPPSRGVIRPPENVDPKAEIAPPDTGTTRVIPPSQVPGTTPLTPPASPK